MTSDSTAQRAGRYALALSSIFLLVLSSCEHGRAPHGPAHSESQKRHAVDASADGEIAGPVTLRDAEASARDVASQCPQSIAADPPLNAMEGDTQPVIVSDANGRESVLRARAPIRDVADLFPKAEAGANAWQLQESVQVTLGSERLVVVLANRTGEGVAAIVLREVKPGYCVINTWQYIFGGNGVDVSLAAVHPSSDAGRAIVVLESAAHYSHGASYAADEDFLVALMITANNVNVALRDETRGGAPDATWGAPVRVIDSHAGTEIIVGDVRHARRFVLDSATQRFRKSSLP